MAVEIEAKTSVEAFEPVRAALRGAGARAAGAHFEVNTFFDRQDRSLLAAGEGLRLRMQRDEDTGRERYIITWKGPQQPGALKSREELELEVLSRDDAVRLLERLGFSRTLSFEKRRESWELGGCKVELDEVPCLGRFVEVEGPDEKTVMSVRERLGLSGRPTIKSSYVALLTDHLRERGRSTTDVTFSDDAKP